MSRHHSSGSASTAAAAMSVYTLTRNWSGTGIPAVATATAHGRAGTIVACVCSFSAVPGSSVTLSLAAALGRGWEVTTFNRGVSGADVAGAARAAGRPDAAADLAALAAAGPWDAVIDTSGYVPREVLASCERLEPVASTVRLHVDGQRLPRVAGRAAVGGLGGALLPAGRRARTMARTWKTDRRGTATRSLAASWR